MDSKKLKKQIENSFKEEFKRLQIKAKGSTYFYTPIDWLIKGFSFDRIDNKLYVSWFIMPLIPESDSLVLTFGDRLKSNKNLDFFELQKGDKLPPDLESSIVMKLKFLDSINDVCTFYKYFYLEKNLSNLSQTWVASPLRLLEKDIYCRAYLALNYDSELDLFKNKWRASKTKHFGWMSEMKMRLNLLDKAVKSGEVESYLNNTRNNTIINLRLGRYFVNSI